MKVNFFSEKNKAKKITNILQFKLKNILKTGLYTNSTNVKNFEEKFKKLLNAKYCIAVNNGTSALHLSLLATGIKENDEVILPSMTFIATAAAIEYIKAKPIFVDINENDWLINSKKIEKLITKNTKAIVVVHLHGLMCDMDEIRKIARKYRLKIIEDSAQAHGSKFKKRDPSHYSDAATFSFYPTKNLGAIGEGGAVLTNNKKVYEKIKRMRTWSHNKNDFYEISFNYRMSEFTAISLLAKLKYLKQDVKRRIEIAEIYKNKLKSKSYSIYNSQLKKHSYHIFAIRVKAEKRINLMKQLKLKGIQTNIHYPYSLSELNVFKKKLKTFNTPKSNKISKELISLPIYPELDDSKINYVTKTINEMLK